MFDVADKSQNAIEKIQKIRELFQIYLPPAIECHEAVMDLLRTISKVDDKDSLIAGMEEIDLITHLAKLTLRTEDGEPRMVGYDIPSLFAVITNLLRAMSDGKLQGIRILSDYESKGLYTGNTWAEGKEDI